MGWPFGACVSMARANVWRMLRAISECRTLCPNPYERFEVQCHRCISKAVGWGGGVLDLRLGVRTFYFTDVRNEGRWLDVLAAGLK